MEADRNYMPEAPEATGSVFGDVLWYLVSFVLSVMKKIVCVYV